MYGRADGMPSFQLTVAVCAQMWFFNTITQNFTQCLLWSLMSSHSWFGERLVFPSVPFDLSVRLTGVDDEDKISIVW